MARLTLSAIPSGNGLSRARTLIARVVVGSFVVAAALGVVALLVGNLGRTQTRVLLTTVLTGTASVVVLACLTAAGAARRWPAALGVIAAVGAWAIGSALFWSGNAMWERPFTTAIVVALTLAQVTLLGAITRGAAPPVATLRTITFCLAGVVAALVVWTMWRSDVPAEWFGRLLGIVAILDALGTVVAPALAWLGRRRPRSAIILADDLQRELHDAAAREGCSADILAARVLSGYLHSPGETPQQ